MVKGISSFSLMAVPFFITMGVLMGSGGISKKLIALANACVGWMRGGLAQVNIVASYFFGESPVPPPRTPHRWEPF
jgi:TRAP-type C4-dicarboxylate transport system permease large subunit